MVQRNSQAPQHNLVGTPSIGNTGAVGSTPDYRGGAFATQVASPPATVAGRIYEGQGTALVQNILGKLGKAVDQVVQQKREEAYLDGAVQLGAGVAEEELETNFFTRNWTVAGHRDMTGRLAVAEYESNLLKALKESREMSPEQYSNEIIKQRKEIMPAVQSMSNLGRTKMFDQLVTVERSAIKQHTLAHAKFIAEQEMQSISADINVTLDNLVANKGVAGIQEAIRDEAYVKIYNNIWNNEKLDLTTKSKLINEAVGYALQGGDFGLYNLVQHMNMPDGEHSIGQSMPFDERLKLSKAFESARNQHEFEIGRASYDQILEIDTLIRNGVFPEGLTYNDYKSILDRATYDKLISRSERDAKLQAFSKLSYEGAQDHTLAQAYNSGDFSVLFAQPQSMNTVAKGMTQKALASGATPAEVAFMQLEVGIRTGNVGALGEWAKLGGAALQALMTSSGEIDQSAKDLLARAMLALDGEDGTLDSGIRRSRMLQELPEDVQGFIGQILSLQEVGHASLDDAILEARAFKQRWDAMDSSARNVEISKQDKMYESVYEQVASPRLLPNLFGDTVKSLQFSQSWNPFSSEAFEIAAWHSEVTGELGAELARIRQSGRPMDEKTVLNLATANVAKRVLNTEFGSVIVPRGLDIATMYGVPKGYEPKELVAKAMSNMYKPTSKDSKTIMRFSGESIQVYDYDPDTLTHGTPTTFSANDIKAEVAREVALEQEGINRLVGDGETLGINGGSVTITGNNTAGVSPKVAFDIRKSLAVYEAVRYSPYDDGEDDKGNSRQSIGIGVNSGNKNIWNRYFDTPKLDKDHTISQEVVDQMYADASDNVLNEAVRRQVTLPQGSDHAAYLTLLSHQLYQRGAPKLDAEDTFQQLQQALSAGDKAEALKLLRQTVAYKAAGTERKQFYEAMLKRI